MKKLLVISILLLIPLISFSQEKEDYKDFKPCTSCFDKWKETKPSDDKVRSNAPTGIAPKSNGFVKNETRKIMIGVISIFVAVGTYVLYSKVNNTANAIH